MLQAELGSNSAAGGGLGGLVAGSLASLAAGGKDGRAVILAVDQSYAAGAEVCCSYGVSSSQVWSCRPIALLPLPFHKSNQNQSFAARIRNS